MSSAFPSSSWRAICLHERVVLMCCSISLSSSILYSGKGESRNHPHRAQQQVVQFSCGPCVAEHVILSPTFLLLTHSWMRLSFSPYCRRVKFATHPSIWLSEVMWWMNSSCADRPHDLENHLVRIWSQLLYSRAAGLAALHFDPCSTNYFLYFFIFFNTKPDSNFFFVLFHIKSL